jgi:hypothetical protein
MNGGRVGALLAVMAGFSLAAVEPLLTDIRLIGGGGPRQYVGEGDSARFDTAVDVAGQFVWSLDEIAPQGSWYFGVQGAFGDRRDNDTDFSLSTIVGSALAGFAVSPEGMENFHAELGAQAGIGAAIGRGGSSNEVSPLIEGGAHGGLYLTWEQLQVGIDLGYRLAITHLDPGTGSSEYLMLRGITAVFVLGMRIE